MEIKMKNKNKYWACVNLVLVLAFAVSPLQAEQTGGSSAADLAKKSQNPVADMISLPIQYNINFETGPKGKTQNTDD